MESVNNLAPQKKTQHGRQASVEEISDDDDILIFEKCASVQPEEEAESSESELS